MVDVQIWKWRIKPFILVFFKLKAEAEIREDSKAVAHKSLFIDDSSSSTSVSRTDNIKLPKLELPTFDGEPLS